MICAECKKWTMGETWGTNPNGKDHGTIVECKGWCLAKPNKRKRWNYQPAHKCKLFDPSEQDTLIISGRGLPTQEQLDTIINFVETKLNKHGSGSEKDTMDR